ncbi:MAG: zinc ribbon domain-containing protein [Microthrixaceae bacterium]
MAEPPTIYCPDCGAPSAGGTHFCVSCGTKLPESVGGGEPVAPEATEAVAPSGPSQAPTEAVTATPPADPAAGAPGGVPPAAPPGAVPRGAVPPGTVPSGTAPPMPGSPQGGGSGRTWWIVGGIAAAILLIGGVVTAVLLLRNDDESVSATAEEVILEPVNYETPDPVTDSVATQTESAVQEDVVRVAAPQGGSAGGQQVAGAQAGLFGGTRNNKVCDREQLITFLAANPAKGEAWAGVHGITADSIPTFVRSLTPVALTRDTRVTNHGFKNGRITTINSVLQAGTAVLVDNFGVPRVKCGCGNPLLEPKALTTSSRYVGTRWPTFAPERTIVVIKEVEVNNFILVNFEDGSLFDRAVGTDGGSDSDVAADKLCELFPDDPSCAEATTTAAPTTAAAPVTVVTPAPAPTAAPAPAPTAAPTRDRSDEAKLIVEDAIANCGNFDLIGGMTTSPGDTVYDVSVTMVDETETWTALYSVDVESGSISPLDADSATVACL